jgi:uncharacterized membrane-anchored protein
MALWQLDPVMAVVLNVRNVLVGGLLVWIVASLWRNPAETAREDGRVLRRHRRSAGESPAR